MFSSDLICWTPSINISFSWNFYNQELVYPGESDFNRFFKIPEYKCCCGGCGAKSALQHSHKKLLTYVDVPKSHFCVITQPVCDYREEHYLHLFQALACWKWQQFGFWVIATNTSEKMHLHCQASICASYSRMIFLNATRWEKQGGSSGGRCREGENEGDWMLVR